MNRIDASVKSLDNMVCVAARNQKPTDLQIAFNALAEVSKNFSASEYGTYRADFVAKFKQLDGLIPADAPARVTTARDNAERALGLAAPTPRPAAGPVAALAADRQPQAQPTCNPVVATAVAAAAVGALVFFLL